MLDFPSILSLFRNKFIRYNNTGAQMLESFYHMTLKLIRKRIFGVKTSRFAIFCISLSNKGLGLL